MALLDITDDYKYGKQEILLGSPTTISNINKCGSEVEPIWAGDIYHKLPDGTVIKLTDYIVQQAITISDLTATVVNGNDITLTWVGNQVVSIVLDTNSAIASMGTNTYTFQDVPVGSHTIKVTAVNDQRGLEQTVVIELPTSSGSNIVITYN